MGIHFQLSHVPKLAKTCVLKPCSLIQNFKSAHQVKNKSGEESWDQHFLYAIEDPGPLSNQQRSQTQIEQGPAAAAKGRTPGGESSLKENGGHFQSQKMPAGTPLAVQWLRLHLPKQGCTLDPWSGSQGPICWGVWSKFFFSKNKLIKNKLKTKRCVQTPKEITYGQNKQSRAQSAREEVEIHTSKQASKQTGLVELPRWVMLLLEPVLGQTQLMLQADGRQSCLPSWEAALRREAR